MTPIKKKHAYYAVGLGMFGILVGLLLHVLAPVDHPSTPINGPLDVKKEVRRARRESEEQEEADG